MNTAPRPTLLSIIFRSILIGAFTIMTIDNMADGETFLSAVGVALIGWNIYIVHRDYNILRDNHDS